MDNVRATSVVDRIVAWADKSGLSRREIAKRAGTTESALRFMGKPNWNPTVDTLGRLEALIPRNFGTEGGTRRRDKAPEGECPYCDRERAESSDFHPPHDASERCRSGKHAHCSCDTCF